MATKPDGTKRKQGAKAGRNARIIAEAATGKTATAIAAEVGLTRQTVSEILNSDEAKAIHRAAENKLAASLVKCVDTVLDNVEVRFGPQALQAALSVLKSHGLIRDKVEIDHKGLKPFVLELRDGSQIVMGMKGDDEDG